MNIKTTGLNFLAFSFLAMTAAACATGSNTTPIEEPASDAAVKSNGQTGPRESAFDRIDEHRSDAMPRHGAEPK